MLQTPTFSVVSNRPPVFDRIEQDRVIIVQMFHERQDFMMKLFGISGRTQESIDYWSE